jgi:hypothetical protein
MQEVYNERGLANEAVVRPGQTALDDHQEHDAGKAKGEQPGETGPIPKVEPTPRELAMKVPDVPPDGQWVVLDEILVGHDRRRNLVLRRAAGVQ